MTAISIQSTASPTPGCGSTTLLLCGHLLNIGRVYAFRRTRQPYNSFLRLQFASGVPRRARLRRAFVVFYFFFSVTVRKSRAMPAGGESRLTRNPARNASKQFSFLLRLLSPVACSISLRPVYPKRDASLFRPPPRGR
eukprot:1106277-Pyramimonas_sp.AAC.1